jgi:trehalose 6-phosphate synthase/phosphatase
MPSDNAHSPPSSLLIVSNRLPITITSHSDSEFHFERSSGGLATALAHTHRERKALWLGWPGSHFRTVAARQQVHDLLKSQHGCVPVFLGARAIQQYYHGFSNRALWPLFHSFQTYFVYNEDEWEAYVNANRAFCEVVLQVAQGDELIWVHDYHLFLLPGMLRQYLPEARIGFFLHTPFPSSEMFRVLPCREAVLRGLLGADLIGFQTFGYMQNFLWAAYRILGIDAETGYLNFGGRQVAFEVHPIGIDPDQFLNAIYYDDATQAEINRLEQSIGNRKLLLGMDRLDYSKGIPARLRAYQRFLKTHDAWHERVTLIQVAVPSRERVLAYQELKRQVDALVGEINGVFGTTSWTPVQYVHRNLPFAQICALLHRADVALITPLRDGMNLVAKEYVACQEDKPGALILSEFAGASSEMGEAFFVNPYDEEGMAERIHEVLSLPEDVLLERMAALHSRICTHTINVWSEQFLSALRSIQHPRQAQPVVNMTRQLLVDAYKLARRRLIMLDYDGTLTPLVPLPHRAVPSDDILLTLRTLQARPGNVVVVCSGRRRDNMQDWFQDSGCFLVAEYGAWLWDAEEQGWRLTLPELNNDWKATIRPLLEQLVGQTPGSILEEKEFSLVWHYRLADPEFALWQARELCTQLQGMLAGTGLQVQNSHKDVEVKWAEVNKAIPAHYLLDALQPLDFVMAIGDDRMDEDLYSAVPKDQWAIKVGTAPSSAPYTLSTPTDVLALLHQLATEETICSK